jgi:hypothetical protein
MNDKSKKQLMRRVSSSFTHPWPVSRCVFLAMLVATGVVFARDAVHISIAGA